MTRRQRDRVAAGTASHVEHATDRSEVAIACHARRGWQRVTVNAAVSRARILRADYAVLDEVARGRQRRRQRRPFLPGMAPSARMYDVVLRGGTVIDPSRGLNAPLDVAIEGGRIAEVAPKVTSAASTRVIDVSGRIVTPGLIDLHAHVFDAVAANGVEPDLAGVRAGVTTIVDAGSSGAATFEAFPRHILPRNHTEVLPFLHICQTGLATNPDIIAAASIDLDATLGVLDRHKRLIRGVKARMVSPALEILGMEMPRLAKRAAKESGVPLMVHIGDTTKRYRADVIRELLPMLEPGDIVTHLRSEERR